MVIDNFEIGWRVLFQDILKLFIVPWIFLMALFVLEYFLVNRFVFLSHVYISHFVLFIGEVSAFYWCYYSVKIRRVAYLALLAGLCFLPPFIYHAWRHDWHSIGEAFLHLCFAASLACLLGYGCELFRGRVR